MRIRRRNLRSGLVAAGCLFADAGPPASRADVVRFASAALVLVVGSLLHLWAKGCLEQNQRLVTAGPYRFTRNPFYLANGLIDLGLCLLIGRVWIAVPYGLIWWLAYRETIAGEETRLAALFPEAFARYVAAVPRLIPAGRALPRAEVVGRFRLDNPALARGSEYARILGVLVAAATIVAWDWIRAHGTAVFAPEQTAQLGLVLLVPVAWVAKLALAEVFRRPETALLPFSAEPGRRRLFLFALVLAVYAFASLARSALEASSGPAPASARGLGSLGLGAALAALLVLPRLQDSPGPRAIAGSALAAGLAIFAASRGVLWLACGALPFLVLAVLDDVALARLRSGSGERALFAAERRLWPMFRPIAIVAPIAAGILALLRRIV